VIAYILYISKRTVPQSDAETKGLEKLLLNKWYVDEIYNTLIVNPFKKLSNIFYIIVDDVLIDGIFVSGIARLTAFTGSVLRLFQSGNVSWYLLLMTLSISAVFGYLYFKI
jgi:NADH-quinone oxidoreductase subunit L